MLELFMFNLSFTFETAHIKKYIKFEFNFMKTVVALAHFDS